MGQASSQLDKTLKVKKLSHGKACASVLSLPLVSSVKAVTDSPSPGCDPTSHSPAARSRGVSHQLRDRNPVLAKSLPTPVLFHAHPTSELGLLRVLSSSPSASLELRRRNVRITCVKTVCLLSARGESLPWKGALLTVNEV